MFSRALSGCGDRQPTQIALRGRGLTVLARKNAADCSHSCPPKGIASSPEPALWFFLRPNGSGAQNIPLETPLARLVTADLAIGVIERDYSAGRKWACGPIEVGRPTSAFERITDSSQTLRQARKGPKSRHYPLQISAILPARAPKPLLASFGLTKLFSENVHIGSELVAESRHLLAKSPFRSRQVC
jgi:hypothetical protein